MTPLALIGMLKERQGVLSLPSRHESFDEMMVRIDVPRHTAEISAAYFFDLVRQQVWIPVKSIARHGFFRWQGEASVRMLWSENREGGRQYFGLRLNEFEAEKFAEVFGLRTIPASGGPFPGDSGVGPYYVSQLEPGAWFKDYLGRVGVVTQSDGAHNVELILFPETVQAKRCVWPGGIVVFSPSPVRSRKKAEESVAAA